MFGKMKKMRLPVLATVILGMIFMFAFVSGAFMYATGEEVVNSVHMKMVSHTEYRFNETGQIVARLVDYQGSAVTVQNCTATILYPDKTYFVHDALMSDSVNISGDHYYTFTTPVNGPEGVYEYQATCNYLQGASPRTSSVTNSFHLSHGFNAVLSNLTDLQTDMDNVFNNLTQLSTDVAAVNASLSSDIADMSAQFNTSITNLSGQLNTNISSVLTQLSSVNSSLYGAIENITAVNLTEVLDNIAALNNSMAANFTQVYARFDTVDSNLTEIDSTLSVIGSDISAVNVTVTDTNTRVKGLETTVATMSATLDYVNSTTVNTYQYMTGTLATNVGDILTQLGVLNATANRIETNTVAINATVNSILENQQNEVVMTTFSG